MQTSSWLLVAIAALAATSNAASTSQCSSVSTCYEGGASSTPCTVSSGGCPPCVTFADDGCYVKVDGSCPFGVDCTSAWGSSTSTSSGSSTPSTTSSDSSTSTKTSSTTGSSTSTTAGTSSKSSTGTSGTAGVSEDSKTSSASGSSGTNAGDSSSGGSDMSVVFAIIGAAIGVIAVAVIFLTLVRRSKAAREDDDDEMANTPPAFSKNPVVQAPHSTTGAAMYSSYNGSNRAPGMGSGNAAEIGLDMSKNGGVSMNAVSYYNQQPPQNSTAPSPRVAGRAIPSQPVGTGMARPYGGNQNFNSSGVGVTSGLGASGLGSSGIGGQAPPSNVQHIPMGGVAPSPHTRRESYEF